MQRAADPPGPAVARTNRQASSMRPAGRVAVLMIDALGFVLAAADPFALLFYATHALLATILIVRRPRQIIGWLLLVIAFGFIGATSEPRVDLPALLAGAASWPDFLAAWASSWSGYALFTAYAALMLLFPSGHFGGGASGRAGRVLVWDRHHRDRSRRGCPQGWLQHQRGKHDRSCPQPPCCLAGARAVVRCADRRHDRAGGRGPGRQPDPDASSLLARDRDREAPAALAGRCVRRRRARGHRGAGHVAGDLPASAERSGSR